MTALLSIGELSARTGLPVRTIRFYSDAGVVPEADRTEAGYRLYGEDALVRLGLVRTLRDLGIDLATIRRVLEREVSVPDVAAAHAVALGAQIRVLRVQKAVLEAVARHGSDPQELQRMHKLAKLSDDERKRIVANFLDTAFEGLDMDPEFVARMKSGLPELPEEPSPEQVDAWIELAELVQDPAFAASVRRMSEQHAAARASGEPMQPDAGWQRAAELVSERAGAALAAGVDPASDEAARIVSELESAFPGEHTRAELADRIATGTDPQAERYWQLLAIINGWPPVPTTVPAWEWFIAALRA
ncbi:MerR family transcriptional regulator [Solirubrobacter sp. CPCC 204708]|uniref:MerR family transcriptional regulator n=1 Tax=Solirubrobacter deserti TaxID=2282478 RepID=A0ABT4RQ64_9ACTN|nr:MerR family transcriptional regulator [Solirubrobacter deserti]MBE2320602.1 MerR family transcriptional regulator [Solirubrobacter deserti]MDA0140657.1 MerR family transcriptional regulator [Solirubrobacter deserti]